MELPEDQKREQRDRLLSTVGITFDGSTSDQLSSQGNEDLQENKPRGVEEPDTTPALEAFLESIALCNIATVRQDNRDGGWKTTDDPTEVALQVFAHRFVDHGKSRLEARGFKQLSEFPFDSSIKRMSTIHQTMDGHCQAYTKGAVEGIVELCTSLGIGGDTQQMTDEAKSNVMKEVDKLSNKGLRVLAVATRSVSDTHISRDDLEKDLTLLSLADLLDPPRLETRDAICECTNAGIKVHMLTGDHPGTAASIAKEVGIIPKDFASTLSKSTTAALVKTASEFDSLSPTRKSTRSPPYL